jgi:hypothetical protein
MHTYRSDTCGTLLLTDARTGSRGRGSGAVLTNLYLDLDHAALKAVAPDNGEVGFDGWSTRL